MPDLLYEYDGALYPSYLKTGNGSQHIAATALHFCKGVGVDVGAGKWPLPGAIPVDRIEGGDAMEFPAEGLGYVFSSHCLEHLADPVSALEYWKGKLKPGGVLFLYLPHPDMTYWRPSRCRKHLHSWSPAQMADILRDMGFVDVIHSERDLAWSFACVAFAPQSTGGEVFWVSQKT